MSRSSRRTRVVQGVIAGAITWATLLTGCRATEAPTSKFIERPELMAVDATLPFNKVYWNKAYEAKDFDEILVAPVNTDYIMAQNFWEKASTAGVDTDQAKRDVRAMADYAQKSFVRAFESDPQHRFKVVEQAGPKTLILETALTQIVPSKAALNAVGYLTWIPTAVAAAGSAATGSQDTGKGVVAIEGRIRHGGNGEIIGMFQDRQNPPTAIVDLKSITWWEPAKKIIDNWADLLVAVANRPPGAIVKPAPTFELLIW